MFRLEPWLVIGTALVLAGCEAQVTAEAEPEAAPTESRPSLEQMTIVDLSHTYDEDTIYWPNSPSNFELEQLSFGETPAGFFYAANKLCTPEHGGTHLDAPIHFAEGKWTADQIPLDRLIGPAFVIDIAGKAATDPDYRLTREDVTSWESAHGEIPADAIVLVRTGWSDRWPDRKRYLGDDTPGDVSNLHFPSFGEEAARFLVEERGVAVIGIDTASIDYGPSTDFIVHQIANGANVPGLENLTNLDQLPPTGAAIIALPLKITGGSGSPLRVVALLEK